MRSRNITVLCIYFEDAVSMILRHLEPPATVNDFRHMSRDIVWLVGNGAFRIHTTTNHHHHHYYRYQRQRGHNDGDDENDNDNGHGNDDDDNGEGDDRVTTGDGTAPLPFFLFA
jgi:hypothetical protein